MLILGYVLNPRPWNYLGALLVPGSAPVFRLPGGGAPAPDAAVASRSSASSEARNSALEAAREAMCSAMYSSRIRSASPCASRALGFGF